MFWLDTNTGGIWIYPQLRVYNHGTKLISKEKKPKFTYKQRKEMK